MQFLTVSRRASVLYGITVSWLATCLLCGIGGAWLVKHAMGQADAADATNVFGRATFPGSQRPPGDPAVIDRGAALFGINCKACHGPDLRGGDLGGPNLLRSQIVLGDQAGEAIIPIVQHGRPPSGNGPPMPAFPLSVADIKAIAEYIHSVVSRKQNQGGPPPGSELPLNILVGDPDRGQQYFVSHCQGCHSATGDLAGLATRAGNPESLQDSWVAGRASGDAAPAPTQVRVTLNSGVSVQGTLRHVDDFTVSLITAQGQYLSFNRGGSQAMCAVEIQDPQQAHRQLLTQYTDRDMHDVTAYLATLR
jgi:cytochrome c oxidase cbb3-type subunit 3